MTTRQRFLDAERKKWLTVEESAYVLRTSHTTIRRMIATGRLAHWKEGQVIRIHLDSLTTTTTEVPHAKAAVPQSHRATPSAAESVLEAARRRFHVLSR